TRSNTFTSPKRKRGKDTPSLAYASGWLRRAAPIKRPALRVFGVLAALQRREEVGYPRGQRRRDDRVLRRTRPPLAHREARLLRVDADAVVVIVAEERYPRRVPVRRRLLVLFLLRVRDLLGAQQAPVRLERAVNVGVLAVVPRQPDAQLVGR